MNRKIVIKKIPVLASREVVELDMKQDVLSNYAADHQVLHTQYHYENNHVILIVELRKTTE